MKDERTARRCAARRLLGILFILHPSAFILTQGCNVIGAVSAKMSPPPKIPAEFVPAKERTVVLVENFHNPASLRLESDAAARHLAEALKQENVAPIVDPSEVQTLRESRGATAFHKMPLDAIARELGAKQVIYVDVERFEVERALASEMFAGAAEARVRVVDDAGAVLWPNDSAGGFPVAVKVDPQRNAQAGSVGGDAAGGSEQAVRQRLHAALADKVSKLFYTWQSEGSEAEEKF
jgi:hypothetical protein